MKSNATKPRSSRSERATSPRPAKRGRTNWQALDATTDEDIRRQIAEDSDVAPELTDELFDRVEALVVEPKRIPISLKVEADVVAFFRESGPGYQTRMNAVLRAYVDAVRSGKGH